MDPQFHTLTSDMQVSKHIFDTLVQRLPSMDIGPGLALSWAPIADDVWEFKLRPNVTFSNGAPFTADDVAFSIDRVAKVPNSPSPVTLYTKRIARVEVVDPLTLRFHTAGMIVDLPQYLDSVFIMSKSAASGPNPEGKSTTQLNAGDGLVGTGPFKFVSWSRGSQIVLERNEFYWGDKPYWKKVTLRPITNPAARVSALLSGGVDLIEDLPTDDAASIKKDPRLTVVSTPSVRLIYVGVNVADDMPPGISGTDGKNPFKDVRVRRAMTEAIDRNALVSRVMDGSAQVAVELMLPGMPGTRKDAKPILYDLAGSQKLMAEAGYPTGFSMTLGAPNGRYVNDLKVAQALASMWGRIGVKTTVDAAAAPIFFKNAETKAYSGFLIGWGDTVMSSRQSALVGTRNDALGTGTTNYGEYSSPAVDELIATAMKTPDEDKRNALLQQVSAKAIDTDVAIFPLYFETTSWGMRKGLTYQARPDQMLLAQYIKPVAAK